MKRAAFSLPPIWHRAAVIGFGMALLWFIGDFSDFETESFPRWTLFYLSMGLSTSIMVGMALSLHQRRFTPSAGRKELTGQFIVTLLALIPGLGIPALVDGYVFDEPVLLADLWGAFLYGAITAAMFLLNYSNKKTLQDLMELRAKTAEARYEMLKAQMQPHFLFNSLNSLTELIAQDPPAAEGMAQKLSDLYKLILQNSESRTATLSSEVAIARRYLEIERLRYEDRLRFEFSVPLESEKIHLPSLMVQTLVENAVKHGIANAVDGGMVSLEVARAGEGWYRLRLTNTGEPFRDCSGGTGLTNTVGRLDLLYGDRHDFRIQCDESQRTVVSFCFSGEAFA